MERTPDWTLWLKKSAFLNLLINIILDEILVYDS